MLLLLLALGAAQPAHAATASAPQKPAASKPGVTVTEGEPPPDEAPPRKRVEIRPDNVDLSGAGWLDFKADSEAVAKAMPGPVVARGLGYRGGGEIVFAADGKPIRCIPERSGIAARGEEELCRQIMVRARFHPNFGYDQPFEAGRFAFTMRMSEVMAPSRPITFLPAGKGTPLTIVTTGKFGSAGCSIVGNPFSADDAAAVCKAWIAAGRPGLANKPGAPPRAAGTPSRSGARPAARPGSRAISRNSAAPRQTARGDLASVSVRMAGTAPEVEIKERMIWKNVDIVYAPVTRRWLNWLSHAEGALRSTFDMMDYPPLALIEEIGGKVDILVGFVREGTPISCRPIGSSGTAYLDNKTCEIAMRRLHFDFDPAVTQFTGQRYMTTSVRWIIPSDLSSLSTF